MSRPIPVSPEKWAEMVQAWAENTRLKAENDELHKDYESLADEHTKLIDRMKTLQAEVERLRKAGDAMAKTIGENGVSNKGSFHDVADSIDRWYAAKEGKQP